MEIENFMYQHAVHSYFYPDGYCRDTGFLLPRNVIEKYHLQATVKYLSHSSLNWKSLIISNRKSYKYHR